MEYNYTIIVFLYVADDTSEDERSLPALTGTDRKTWAQIRNQYFSEGTNRHSLHMIEKAIFCVSNLYMPS